MNFRFTKWKTIISLILSLIAGVYAHTQAFCFDCTSGMINKIKIQMFIALFILVFVLVYGLWSSFEQGKGIKDKKVFCKTLLGVIGTIVVLILVFLMLAFVIKS